MENAVASLYYAGGLAVCTFYITGLLLVVVEEGGGGGTILLVFIQVYAEQLFPIHQKKKDNF